jgi:hypothetical protein
VKKLKYNKMACEKMEHQIEMMYFNILQKIIIDIHVEIEKQLMSLNLKFKLNKILKIKFRTCELAM